MKSYIVCKCCGKNFKRITQTHLKKHGLTPEEYKEKYKCDLLSEASKQIQSSASMGSQHNSVISNLNKLGFSPMFTYEEYNGVFEKHDLKCNKCGNEFNSKLNDYRKIKCRKCNPKKTKQPKKFIYVDVLDGFKTICVKENVNLCGIYAIKNKTTGKFYIGSSKDINGRWYTHTRSLCKNEHGNARLQNAWNKYKKDDFEFLMIMECSENSLLQNEQIYLDKLKPYERGVGYNLNKDASGGDFYSLLSDKEKENFINKCKKSGTENGMYGKKHSDSTKQKQKEKAKGRFSLNWFIDKYGIEIGTEQYNKRIDSLKNRDINYSHNNKQTGKKRKPLTYKQKQKISDQKERIKKIEPELKEAIISEEYTIKELEERFNISKTTILSRKRKYLR